MNLQIRSASANDIPEMHRVRRAVRENRLSANTRITESAYLPFIEQEAIWLAEADEGIAGFAAIDRQEQRLWALFVDPQFEGQGIGRALHAHMIDWANRQGLDQLILSTDQSSRAAQFYAQSGWKLRAVEKDGEAIFEMILTD